MTGPRALAQTAADRRGPGFTRLTLPLPATVVNGRPVQFAGSINLLVRAQPGDPCAPGDPCIPTDPCRILTAVLGARGVDPLGREYIVVGVSAASFSQPLPAVYFLTGDYAVLRLGRLQPTDPCAPTDPCRLTLLIVVAVNADGTVAAAQVGGGNGSVDHQ